MPVQGFLADAADAPVNGAVSIRFRLYDQATGGNVLFDETQSVVNVDQGYFTAYLGDAEPLELALFREHPIVFVGVLVSGDTAELSPRLQLSTAPYAAFAQACGDASTLGGQGPSAFRPSSYVPAWSEVTGKPGSFPPSTHGHAWTDITSGVPSGLADGDNDTTYSAGAGLTLNGSNQFAVNTSSIQTKLGTACPGGQYAFGVNPDGSFMCRADVDTNTTYSAGVGIDISGGNAISLAPDNGSCAVGQVLKFNANGTWTCQADADNGITQAAADGRYLGATVTRQDRIGAARFAGGSGWSQGNGLINLTSTSATAYAQLDIPSGASLKKIRCALQKCGGSTATISASMGYPGSSFGGTLLLPSTTLTGGGCSQANPWPDNLSASADLTQTTGELMNLGVTINSSTSGGTLLYCIVDYTSSTP